MRLNHYTPEKLKKYRKLHRGCWLWTRGHNGGGYGICVHGGKTWVVHRLSALLHKIPNWQHLEHNIVLHKCDTPGCFNPDHLQIGTQLQNIDDMKVKGRWHPLKKS